MTTRSGCLPALLRQSIRKGLAGRLIHFLICLLPLLCATAAQAFSPPAFQGDVLDEAGKLSLEQRSILAERISELRERDGIWAAIYVTGSLQGESIEEAAVATFEKWKLGRRDKDNGLLVMLAPNERKMRIEVGYGLEGTITDVLSKHVIDDIFKPAFREDRYAEGLLAGLDFMAQAMRAESPAPAAASSGEPDPQPLEIDGGMFMTRLSSVWLGNLCVPLLYLGVQRFRARRRADYADKLKSAFILFAFFGLFFGLFVSVFSLAFPDDSGVVTGLLAANALFGLVFFLPLVLAGKASGSGRSTPGWSSSASSSSSTWDAGSSDSSSSGGGSSGGGGASGDY